VVEATVRLLVRSSARATIAVTFGQMTDAISAVLALGKHPTPAAVEVMDRTTVTAINEMTRMGLDESAEATLLVQCDGETPPRPPRRLRRR
jgi:D-lactate dehydrogenase (cytochrome)/glycolate oxidase